jgi:hypothetical protein
MSSNAILCLDRSQLGGHVRKREKAEKEPTLLSLLDAAVKLGISLSTARRYALDGLLPHIRIAGRIRIQSDAIARAKREGIGRK